MKLNRSEQSRINGAKSKGPTSAAGKAISSKNALKHGFAAVINVVIRVEDKAAFELHAASLRGSYQPKDYAETVFVDQLAAISWRQARLVSLETALLDAQIGYQHDHLTTLNPESAADPYFHLVQAWQALARPALRPDAGEIADPSLPPDGYDIGSMELLRRYQTSLDRQYRNTLLNLKLYRQDLAPSAPETPTAPEEPEKTPTPPPQNPPIRALTLVKDSRTGTTDPIHPPPGTC